jgi:hypothetical protein
LSHHIQASVTKATSVRIGTFKVDAFEKCGLRISISHFGHNSADFKRL